MNKKYLLALLLSGLTFTACFALEADQESPKRSLDLSLAASYSYKDSFGHAGLAYVPMLTYSYLLSEEYALGITLLRFSHFFQAADPLFVFGYGFQFKHFWPRKWADLGPWAPWMSYSILLNQCLISGKEGRGIAHDSRLALGSDYSLGARFRVMGEIVWDYTSYPSFETKEVRDLIFVSAGLGVRWLF